MFEAHTRPGGVCTSWKRGDYIFDYCIHWLVGTSSGTGYDSVWKELGMLEDEYGKPTPIVNFDNFTRIELPGGEVVRLYSDAGRVNADAIIGVRIATAMVTQGAVEILAFGTAANVVGRSQISSNHTLRVCYMENHYNPDTDA